MSQQMGTMSLALRSITDASQKTEAVEDTRRGGVNIVRFGVGTMTTPR
jgi:Flp pilus assembly protein CpaB